MWIPTEGGSAEGLARYGGFVEHRSESGRFGLELTGLAILTESGGGFGDRTSHELGVSVGGRRGGVTPTLFARVPIDGDLRDLVTATVGVRLEF